MDPELSPNSYPESPVDDDEIFLCKGCGEVRRMLNQLEAVSLVTDSLVTDT